MPQRVYVRAVDDGRSEGDRTVVVQHSVIAQNPASTRVPRRRGPPGQRAGLRQRHPRRLRHPVDAGHHRRSTTAALVIEGQPRPSASTTCWSQLAKDPCPAANPGCGLVITVKITMDADSQRILQIDDCGGRTRPGRSLDARPRGRRRHLVPADVRPLQLEHRGAAHAAGPQQPGRRRPDDRRHHAAGQARRDATPTGSRTCAAASSAPTSWYTTTRRAQVVTIPTGTDTCHRAATRGAERTTLHHPPDHEADRRRERSRSSPDGLVDVVKIDGVAVTPLDYVVIGGDIPSRALPRQPELRGQHGHPRQRQRHSAASSTRASPRAAAHHLGACDDGDLHRHRSPRRPARSR